MDSGRPGLSTDPSSVSTVLPVPRLDEAPGAAFCMERVDCLVRFPEDGRERMVDSERLAIALDVLSRAKEAKLKKPVRLGLEELADGRCL